MDYLVLLLVSIVIGIFLSYRGEGFGMRSQ